MVGCAACYEIPAKDFNLGLQFSAGEGNSVVEAYSDADFANALSLKSVSGNMLMTYGNCVFWRYKRQDIIAGDTTEAELIGMSTGANELMWLKMFCIDLAIDASKPTLCQVGANKSANLIAVNPVSSDRSKYMLSLWEPDLGPCQVRATQCNATSRHTPLGKPRG